MKRWTRDEVKAIAIVVFAYTMWRIRKAFKWLRRREPLHLNLPPRELIEGAPVRVKMPAIPLADDEERHAARQLELHTRSAYLEPSRAIAHRERLGLPIPTVISPTMLEVVTEAKKQIDEANVVRDRALHEIDRLNGIIGAAHLVLNESGILHEPNLVSRIRSLQADRATWKSRGAIMKRERDTFADLEAKVRDLLWLKAPKIRQPSGAVVSQIPASTVQAVRELIERYERRFARARSKPKAKRRK